MERMLEIQTDQNKADELNRCRERNWLSPEDQARFGISVPAEQPEESASDPIHPHGFKIGQHVFLNDGHLIGRTTKLFYTQARLVSHLAIRTARLLGHHKIIPVVSVNEVNSKGVFLAGSRDSFGAMPNYKTDTVLAEEAHTPELLALFRARLVAPRRQMLRDILERAESNGELRGGVNLDAVVNLLVGAFYARYLADPSIPSDFPQDLVDVIWSGIARLAPQSGPTRSAAPA